MADAWHHRSDAFSSVGSLIGIGGAMFGFPVLDPLASVVICIFILKVAFDIFKDALDKMLDTSCSEEYEEKLADYIRKSRGSRKTGSVKNENVRQQGVYRCRDCSRWNTFVERCACNCRGCARQCRKEVSEYKAYYDSCKSGIMGKKYRRLSNFEKVAVFFSLLVLSEKFNPANESMFSFVL